jgi:4-amino-4-deoxy-L-arabinose transferase-like glycosyltransferase
MKRFFSAGRWLWSVLALAFVIRVAVFLAAWWNANDYAVFHAKDTATYLQPAAELLATGRFTAGSQSELMRTPGYPLLLTLSLAVGHVELVTILLQIVLSCLTCWLVYVLARQLFGNERTALCAAFLFSLEPLSILHSCLLLSDTLFVFLLAAALTGLVRYCQQRRFSALLLAALALAAAIYTRPVGYFLPLGLTLLLFAWALAKKDRRLLQHAAVFCLLAMSLVGLWQVRNRLATGYAGFSTTTEIVLYFYHGGAVQARQQGVPFYQVVEQLGYYDPEIYFRLHPEQQAWTPEQRYAYLRSEGFKTLRQAPATAAQVYGQGVVVMLLDPGVIEYLKLFRHYQKSERLLNVLARQGLLAALRQTIVENPRLVFWGLLLGALLGSFYLLSMVGLNGVLLRAHLPLLLLLGTCFYFIAVSGGIVAVGRFRAPVMPFLSVFAGQGLALLLARAQTKRAGRNQAGLAPPADV